jgi:hypothetical protein
VERFGNIFFDAKATKTQLFNRLWPVLRGAASLPRNCKTLYIVPSTGVKHNILHIFAYFLFTSGNKIVILFLWDRDTDYDPKTGRKLVLRNERVNEQFFIGIDLQWLQGING